jgi:hypothetical protein
MEIQLNRLQCRTFSRFMKKIEFNQFSLEDADDDVIIRMTDVAGWELTIQLDPDGKIVDSNKKAPNESQQIQPQNS